MTTALSEEALQAIASDASPLDEASLKTFSESDVRAIASRMKWFHAMDLGLFQSSGRFPSGEPQNQTLYPVMDLLRDIDLTGKDCLDIGCFDGLTSFGLKMRGASEVAATCTTRHNTFLLSRHLLNLKIDYFPGSQIKDLESLFSNRKFDLIICAGVLYHMLHPMTAFTICRKLLKKKGLLILETAYSPNLRDATMALNSESTHPLLEPFTYWVPSLSAVSGMMKLTGFNVLAQRSLRKPSRVAVLGQAVPVAEIENRTPLTKLMHELDFADLEFKLRTIDSTKGPSSTIRFCGSSFRKTIDPFSYLPSFPPHPTSQSCVLGSTQWRTASGNVDISFRRQYTTLGKALSWLQHRILSK